MKWLKSFSYATFIAMLALIAIGTTAIYSAGHAREAVFHDIWISNLETALFGLVVYFVIAFADYRKILAFAAVPAYLTALAMLTAVLLFGTERFGGRRWLWFFQPSEISKLCVIVFMAAILPKLKGFKGFALAALAVVAPCLLILLEPDLGTTLTLVPAVAVMIFAAGVWRKGFSVILIAGAAVGLLTLALVNEAVRPDADEARREKILAMLPLRHHQVERVKTFLYPESDRQGAGYNLRQAKMAIASGGMVGKGIGKGELNHLKYLPQSVSMNDFIFCVWAEETGFVGSLALLALYALLLVPGAIVAVRARDLGGRLAALGITTLIFAHVYVNVGMSVGLVPITGLPLPFISAGRTFLVTAMAGLGLVQSVAVRNC